jgi:cell division protein FtsL
MDRVQNLTQAYSQAPWRKQLQVVVVFLVVVVFVAIVDGVYLNITARAAAVGREIQRMQNDIDQLQRDNADLESKLAFITSAEQMQKRAEDLGFKPRQTDDTVYLMVNGYVERQPVILAPAPAPITKGAPLVPPEYTESLFDWLQREVVSSSLQFIGVQQ